MIARRPLIVATTLLSVACAVGPGYLRPETPVPTSYGEAPAAAPPPGGPWKEARPRDEAQRGRWWEVFGDVELDGLEEQVAVSNPSFAEAEAQYRGARAAVRLSRAGLYPELTASASVTRSSGAARGTPSPAAASPSPATVYAVPAEISWEADVFGRVRRSVESSVASAQASAADAAAVRLGVEAELAVDYFTLRGLDAERQLLDSTVAGYETALTITRNRYDQGIVSGIDVAQAETQLETTRALAIDVAATRARFEHAVAILVGKPPAGFAIPPVPIHGPPPEVPAGLPSDLLERRPDVAASERRVAAANGQIGAAKAAYFPSLTLSATGGFEGSALAGLLSLPNRFWSLGPALVETLFDGGRRRAAKEQALASYDASVAAYRESVLTAIQEVEDQLASLRILSEEATQQAEAVAAAERSLTLAKNRYQGGITTYLEVVSAQSAALTNERTAVDLLTRRMVASVGLVKALGGGWRSSDLPFTLPPAGVTARSAP